MAIVNQKSIISYVPQPYYINSGTCGDVTLLGGIDTIENAPGIVDPDLSNFLTANLLEDADDAAFEVEFDKIDAHLTDHNFTIALIGCSLKTYDTTGSGPDLDTEVEEDIMCLITASSTMVAGSSPLTFLTYAHNSANAINTFCKVPLPGIIAGGTTNLIASGIGLPDGGDGSASVQIRIFRLAPNVTARPFAKLIVGHLFIGVELPITQDPNTFTWNIRASTQRFFSRDQGAKNSEGTLIRQASGEIRSISHNDIIGSDVTSLVFDGVHGVYVPDTVDLLANFFDLTKFNNSYPVLFNPFPVDSPDDTPAATNDVDVYNLSARQNFFSIYGFLDGALEIQTGEYRDGLNSEYKARFRIEETR